jgi:hypothetical protein
LLSLIALIWVCWGTMFIDIRILRHEMVKNYSHESEDVRIGVASACVDARFCAG